MDRADVYGYLGSTVHSISISHLLYLPFWSYSAGHAKPFDLDDRPPIHSITRSRTPPSSNRTYSVKSLKARTSLQRILMITVYSVSFNILLSLDFLSLSLSLSVFPFSFTIPLSPSQSLPRFPVTTTLHCKKTHVWTILKTFFHTYRAVSI